ncbi:hypothetical protein EVAR_48163_1 [Eumeta japonica]|uniref:Uncharacterized protein n=1 Tax=Eumeta variegata TaxID=151549 RepID=A0A4C1WQ46_EUMVA|nr:hypothetical protein EVAR_48163_1 [Eumeta japonica]
MVPGRHNPADLATRNPPTDFNENHKWFKGPELLSQSKNLWLTQVTTLSTEFSEERKLPVLVRNTVYTVKHMFVLQRSSVTVVPNGGKRGPGRRFSRAFRHLALSVLSRSLRRRHPFSVRVVAVVCNVSALDSRISRVGSDEEEENDTKMPFIKVMRMAEKRPMEIAVILPERNTPTQEAR